MSSNNPNLLSSIVLAVIVTLAAGCADFATQSNLPADEAVRLRAQAWTDELMAGNLEGAWALTSPSYRQFSTWQQYASFVQGSGRWTSATVDTVQCADDVCEVQIEIEYEQKTLKIKNRRPLDYKWVKVDGEWWLHVPAK